MMEIINSWPLSNLCFRIDMSMEINNEHRNNTKVIIQEYLEGKINEIKFISSTNETHKCHENCLEILQKSENLEGSDLKVSNTWQRVHNNKLIIGICVENSSSRSAANINVIFNNDINNTLTYTTKLYTKYKPKVNKTLDSLHKDDNPAVKSFVNVIEDLTRNNPTLPITDQWIPTLELDSVSTIVIVLDIPKFINFKSFDLQGVLLYEKRNKKFQIRLPPFSLTVDDFTSEKHALKINNILVGTDEAYLSIIASSIFTSVKVIIPKGIYRKLDGLLQMNCFFTKTEVHCNKLVLVYDGNSQCLKNVILRVCKEEKEPIIDIFTKNNDQLHLLYHHFYSKIPGVIILDNNCEAVIDRPGLCENEDETIVELEKSSEEPLLQFINSFQSLLIFVEDNFKKCYEVTEGENEIISNLNLNKISDNYENFRRRIAELEKRADEHFRDAINAK